MKNRSRQFCSLAVFQLFLMVQVQAQTMLDEVVVTAQRREENVQDVPVSVTAFSAEAIESLGFQDATSVPAQAVNVNFRNDGTNPLYSIRGVMLLDNGDGNEPPVGFYRDDVYRGTLAGQASQLFDLERVEILRGPQGTLFGRNTTGGLIHFVTRKPTDDFEGYGEVQLGSFDQFIAEGVISGPLNERIRGRLSEIE